MVHLRIRKVAHFAAEGGVGHHAAESDESAGVLLRAVNAAHDDYATHRQR
jgi:hypothetical protein